MASPVPTASFALPSSLLGGFTVHGDILTLLPGTQNNFQHIDTDTSDAAAVALSHIIPEPILTAERLMWGKKIHDVDNNYMLDRRGRQSLQADLITMYASCLSWPQTP